MNVEPFINKHDVFSTAIITNVKLKVYASGYMVDTMMYQNFPAKQSQFVSSHQ